MNNDELLKIIKKKENRDIVNRRDPRFLNTMGFLVAKGFLKTNYSLPLTPNRRLVLDDVIWAGQNIEPRILEVLPAAVLRLGKHFDFNPKKHIELNRVIEQLKKNEKQGDDFFGIPYKKIKIWTEFQLPDKRVKKVTEKKIMKTLRLSPAAQDKLKKTAELRKCTETEVIENFLLGLT